MAKVLVFIICFLTAYAFLELIKNFLGVESAYIACGIIISTSLYFIYKEQIRNLYNKYINGKKNQEDIE